MKFKKKRYISLAAAVLSLTAMTSCGTVVQKVDSPVVNTGTAQKGSTVSTTAATAENTETAAITAVGMCMLYIEMNGESL